MKIFKGKDKKVETNEDIEKLKDQLYSYDNIPNSLVNLVEGYLDYAKEKYGINFIEYYDNSKPVKSIFEYKKYGLIMDVKMH